MTKITVTEDDLLQALRDALAQPTDAQASTMTELAAAMGFGLEKVRHLLRAVQDEGRLEVVRLRRPNLIGTTSLVPGYRIKPKK